MNNNSLEDQVRNLVINKKFYKYFSNESRSNIMNTDEVGSSYASYKNLKDKTNQINHQLTDNTKGIDAASDSENDCYKLVKNELNKSDATNNNDYNPTTITNKVSKIPLHIPFADTDLIQPLTSSIKTLNLLPYPIKTCILDDKLLQSYIDRDILSQIPLDQVQFIASSFLVDKLDSTDKRLVTNFAPLVKRFTHPYTFKSNSICNIQAWAAQLSSHAHIDISDAFFHIKTPIHLLPFLCTSLNNNIFTYKRIPMGFSESPALWVMTIEHILSLLPKILHKHYRLYMDDIYISTNSDTLTNIIYHKLINHLIKFNIKINMNKSTACASEIARMPIYSTAHVPRSSIVFVRKIVNRIIIGKQLFEGKVLFTINGHLRFIYNYTPHQFKYQQQINNLLTSQTFRSNILYSSFFHRLFCNLLIYIDYIEKILPQHDKSSTLHIHCDASQTHLSVVASINNFTIKTVTKPIHKDYRQTHIFHKEFMAFQLAVRTLEKKHKLLHNIDLLHFHIDNYAPVHSLIKCKMKDNDLNIALTKTLLALNYLDIPYIVDHVFTFNNLADKGTRDYVHDAHKAYISNMKDNIYSNYI
eukprot:GHVL01015418.1.p1 GENE.GHVL01015418.1~~GHVL01015418.1.p1  ORF type:complete len:585 (+),score=13.47 GHVL01015418.1:469-2223(+)